VVDRDLILRNARLDPAIVVRVLVTDRRDIERFREAVLQAI